MEHNQRRARGREVELQDHLRRLKSRATNSTLRAVDGAVEIVPDFVDFDVAKDFLLAGLQDVGIKRRQNLVKGVWTDLESLIPYGAVFDFNISTDPEDNIIRRCVFWGVAVRLAELEGEPPQDTDDFLAWCGLTVHQREHERRSNQWWTDFTRSLAGTPSTCLDRSLLDLPAEGSLTTQAIKSAYRAAAKKAHPDLGGSAKQMTQINEAKARLILEVDA